MIIAIVALFWGASVVADSAQLSTGFTKLSEEAYRGTALTFQTGLALDNHCSRLDSTCPG